MKERTVEFKLRLSPEEHAALRAHAEKRGLKAVDVLRLHIRSLDEFDKQEPKKGKR